MAERGVEKVEQRTKRVFINNLDSYTSKCIAKFLSACVVGASLMQGAEAEVDEEEEHTMSQPDQGKANTFQIVGTTVNNSEEKRPYVLEEYFQPEREDLLKLLMGCDVIIYNITQHADQVDEASWAITALHSEMSKFDGPKMFILISTVMTWALSKPLDPDDPEIPFTDEDYRRRRAHPNFKKHIDLEKLVVKMGKTKRMLFSTYIVASGLQYGMGEQVFHYFFKMSWLGEVQTIPVFGEGSNVVPTIHIIDLASVIQNVIDLKPKPYYLLAVDESKNTMEDIVKTVATVLGPGKIQSVPFEDAFLTQDLSQMEINSILVNLCMEAVYLKEQFNFPWVCEMGLVENIERVVEEYKQTRGLLPIRICILGPPAVGKTTVAEKISNHYKLHHIKVMKTITETIAHLEATVKNDNEESEEHEELEDSVAAAQELLDTLRDSIEQNSGRLEDHLVIKVMREKLKSKPCRNQGYVLDAFPKTYEQAKELFYGEEDEPDNIRYKIPQHNKKIIPDFVICLGASDGFLKERVLNLPEEQVQGTSYSQEQFLRRLARYRENNVEDETVLNYFDELEILPQHIEITSNDDPDYLLVTQKIIQAVGPPKNYGPTSQELEEEERRAADERIRREAQVKAEIERRDMEEAAQRAAHWEEWCQRREEVKRQEEELLEAHSLPLRSYLMKEIMPTLAQGLMECCSTRPQDPVDFLAEYLFKNNPLNE